MVKEGKFFSLIRGGDIRLAPETKVLPAADIDKVVSAEEILKAAKKQSEGYRQKIAEECELLKEQAQAAGFEEGQAKWNDQLAYLEKKSQEIRGELEQAVVPIALQAAKKIVGQELELNKEAVVAIVANSLKTVSQHRQVTIYVNKNDLEALEKNKDRLRSTFEHLETLSIQERSDIEPGGCIIETEVGIINAKLKNQWKRLENAVQKVVESSTKTKQPPKPSSENHRQKDE
ncbi:MAG: HrpE/YscL family type III secretion apparatus protein [Chlamydiota bacterium]